MRHCIFLLLFVCLACESKPTHSDPTTASGKVTREEVPVPQIQFDAVLEQGPAAAESVFLTSPAISDCLREAHAPVQVHLKGRLNAGGRLTAPQVEGGSEPLRACLRQALSTLEFERGLSGSVLMHFSLGTKPCKPAKPFVIDLKRVKKFE
ncbi:MAG: hypothetical protein KF799_11545 [Bdellovibrionales bacterium]|nr:hypothetical protein [Bdellovibrionales bacterium]